MYWQETPEEKKYELTDQVVDICFKLECKSLPMDHAWSLSTALLSAVPQLQRTQQTAIQLIHGAESGNGWLRPEETENALLHLSRRARFNLRLHRENMPLADEISGLKLDIDGHPLTIKEHKITLLVPQTTIFSRYIQTQENYSEENFLNEVAPAIQKLGIEIRKMMGGRQHVFRTPEGPIYTRSLMLSDLEKEESIRLQQHGIGEMQLMGMGIFLPHKGVAAVKELYEELPGIQPT